MGMDALGEPGATGNLFFLRAGCLLGDYGSSADPFSGAKWVGGGGGSNGAIVVGFKKHVLSVLAQRQKAVPKEKRGAAEPSLPPAGLPGCCYWQAAG